MSTIRLVAAGLLLLSAIPALADEAADTFSKLYGEDLKRVAATPSAADDLALAKQLLEAAGKVTHQPAFLTLLCEKAHELAIKDPAGYPTAKAAAQLLAANVAEKKVESLQKMAAMYQRPYATARGDAKSKAGEALVEALKALADAQAAEEDTDGAGVTLKQALAVATTIKSQSKAALQAQLAGLGAQQQVEKQIAALKAKLEKDPQDAASRKEIVRLYLVEMNNPAEAAKFVDETLDEATRKYVPAAAKPIEEAPELACNELGDWYRTLGEAAAPGAKAAMCTRAKGYYERFLELHTAEDLDRTAATLALKRVEAALEKLSSVTKPKDQWIDLLNLANPATDVVRGSWKRQGTALTASAAGINKDQILSFPMTFKGSYEFQITLARTAGNDVFGFDLPVGPSSVSFGLGWFGQRGSGFFPVNNKYPHEEANTACARPGTVEPNRKYTFNIRVLAQDDVVQMSALLDGKPFVTWKGSPSVLSSWDSWSTPAGRISLACRGSDVVVSVARLRMLSGEAKPLRPAGK
ncbi:MAG: hypothetical protein IMZ69_00845 [Spirochaetes bacterium]|nr:hypothetical protein [Spirochaetota bacterium]